jgi:GNAT superfamily N-acetyltransferase
MAIRAPSARDAPAIAMLLAELGYPAERHEIPGRVERMCADGTAAVFVAGADGPSTAEVLGVVTVHALSVLHAEAPVAQLTALVVHATARGRGVGAALVAAAERWARARGAARIVVTTALHRVQAPRFYERLGYEHTGRRYVRTL